MLGKEKMAPIPAPSAYLRLSLNWSYYRRNADSLQDWRSFKTLVTHKYYRIPTQLSAWRSTKDCDYVSKVSIIHQCITSQQVILSHSTRSNKGEYVNESDVEDDDNEEMQIACISEVVIWVCMVVDVGMHLSYT